MARTVLALLLPLLLAAPTAGAQEPAEEAVRDCVQPAVPEPDSVRALRMTSRDPRADSQTVTVLKMYGRRTEEGRRQLFVRFLRPDDVRGSALLFLEKGDGVELYLATPEIPEPRRISGPGRTGELFGTNLSYEDFERLQGLRPPRTWTRLEDEAVSERPTYAIETRPEDSAYDRVKSFVDKESCIPLLMRFYQSGKLRKELTTNPRSNLRRGAGWMPHEAVMRDFRNGTTTHLLIDSHEQDVLLPDGLFTPEGLKEAVRSGSSPGGAPAES
jgi:hypothetical protein